MKRIFFLCLLFVGCNRITDVCYTHPASCINDFIILEQPDDISCGPTCASMLLRYAGQDVSIEEMKVAARTKWFNYRGKEFGMTTPECLATALTKYGIKSSVKETNLSALKYYVSQGRLPIVLVRSDKSKWHYVVVFGYTETEIHIADPAGQIIVIPIEQFMRAWSFQTDIYGCCVLSKCPSCNGKGRKLNLPFDQCTACGGTGKQDNWLPMFLKLFNAHPYTLIVPNTNLKGDFF